MFTGIIQDLGTVVDIDKSGDWVLKIKPDKLALFSIQVGSSIACSGIYLTIIAKSFNSFLVQASVETLSKTTVMKWGLGTRLNLESAMKLGDDFGGHIVKGHIDGVAFLTSKGKVGDSLCLQFEVPSELTRFLAPKGLVAVDGVSLTTNEIDHAVFNVNITPHMQNMTTLGKLAVGDAVNLEVDILARYIERLMHPSV